MVPRSWPLRTGKGVRGFQPCSSAVRPAILLQLLGGDFFGFSDKKTPPIICPSTVCCPCVYPQWLSSFRKEDHKSDRGLLEGVCSGSSADNN